MPVAGDEGYERTVICPYDRAHEIRIGRMQFHLMKCRQNFPLSDIGTCPLNSSHRVREMEMNFHIEEECEDRKNWDRFTHNVETTESSVKDLVPVNAGQLPECEENWDDEEVKGSVLDIIQKQVECKPLLRMKQCVSKSQRKNFRKEQRRKFAELEEGQQTPSLPATSLSNSRLAAGATRQQPETSAFLDRQLENMDLNSTSSDFPPLRSAQHQAAFQPSDKDFPSLGSNMKGKTPGFKATKKTPTYCASSLSADSVEDGFDDPSPSNTTMNFASTAMSRPSTAMSLAMSSQPSRPSSAFSVSSVYSTANNTVIPEDEGFSPLQVPGLGRGKKAKK